jgi:hypothetical protein
MMGANCKHLVVPALSRDPYGEDLRWFAGAEAFCYSLTPGVIGPGVRRDDEA